ncbi:cytochrome P450 [Chryseobacterium nematophagum]|uniref:Cytochrome P450 n=1 Tax=Chryseobacterium nematophagum TaxID=2305228 RepID=A0A3M7L9Y6_9FLAO|nr:cytochrome P450 [Chryseobacterium nematophagum]RMZ58790.1 cytochrome P450 [Chryseobacterium nematophagum]
MNQRSFITITNQNDEFSILDENTPLPSGWQKFSDKSDLETCITFLQNTWEEKGNQGRCPISFPIQGVDYKGLEIDSLQKELLRLKRLLWVKPPYGDNAWLVSNFKEVRSVLRDDRFSRQQCPFHNESRLTPHPLDTSIMGLDAPDHTRIRSILDSLFSVSASLALKDRVEESAYELIDLLGTPSEPIDLVEEFVMPFSGLTICEIMGVPFEDRSKFRIWLDSFSSTTLLDADQVAENMDAMHAYMGELIEIKRKNLGDDLISGLTRANEEGKLSDKELLELITVVLIAGHDTVSAQLMLSLFVILSDSTLTQQLKEDPNLSNIAIKELLRYIPVDAYITFARYAKEDVVMADGTVIKQGEAVLPSLISANQDPEVFENPDSLDLNRSKNPHLMFGAGIHICPGGILGMIEIKAGICSLFQRFPNISLAVSPEEIRFREGLQVRSIYELPVYLKK